MDDFEQKTIAGNGAKSGNQGDNEGRMALAENEKSTNGDGGGENRGEQESTEKGANK